MRSRYCNLLFLRYYCLLPSLSTRKIKPMAGSATQAIKVSAPVKQNNLMPLIIIGVLFFLFGFVTWANSTLMIYLKIACELTTSQVLWVTYAFYISYAVMAFPCSFILSKTGLKKGMMLGLFIMAAGAIIFVPAANSRNFSLFLFGLFIIGTGLALLQTASNPYVTVLGPIESAASRISFMGICNKLAAIAAPLILSAIILSNGEELQARLATMTEAAKNAELSVVASKVIMPYTVIAIVLVILGIGVYFSKLPEIQMEDEEAANKTSTQRNSIFQYPYLWLGFTALFLYVGVEVMAGDVIQLYGSSIGIKINELKNLTSYTMAGMLTGYVIGILTIPRLITQKTALTISAVLGVIFTLGAIFSSGFTSVLFIALLGLANALMWPAIWPLAIGGLGRFTNFGAALLIVGIAGGAAVPKFWNLLATYLHTANAYTEASAYQTAFWIMVPCYLFILYFAVKGNKVGKAA